jgi:putative ABC transport system permease protein
MAVGALPQQVLRSVLGGTLALTALGILCGFAAALAATRLLGGFLYGVKPADPTVLCASAVMLLATATVAGYVPARRAARIDPVAALREE